MHGGLSTVLLERPSFQCVLDESRSRRGWRSATKEGVERWRRGGRTSCYVAAPETALLCLA